MYQVGLAPLTFEVHSNGKQGVRRVATWVPCKHVGVISQDDAAILLHTLGRPHLLFEGMRTEDEAELNTFIRYSGRNLPGPESLLDQLSMLAKQPTTDPATYGIILALGEFPLAALTPSEQQQASEALRAIISRQDDLSAHSAAVWLLYSQWRQRQYGQDAVAGSSAWVTTPDGRPMAIVEPSQEHRACETYQLPSTPRYAISAFEVTVGEFRKRYPSHGAGQSVNEPVAAVSFFEIAEYCNWLSDRANLTRCFDIGSEDNEEVIVPADYLLRKRLSSSDVPRMDVRLLWAFAV